MSGAGTWISLEDLAAHLDGELPRTRRLVVERHLEDHPQDAARIAEWRRRDLALRRGLAALAEQAQVLGPAPSLRRAGRSRAAPSWVQAAAIALLLATGSGLSAWWLRGEEAVFSELRNGAAIAHRAGSSMPLATTDEAMRRSLEDGISAHLGVPVTVPDLADFGFRLAGGQILSGSDRPAAQLIFVRADGQRLTCYFQRIDRSRDRDLGYSEAGGIPGVYRLDDGLGWAVLGNLGRAELDRIATASYPGAEGRETE